MVLAIPPADEGLQNVDLLLWERLRRYGDLQVYVICDSWAGELDPRLGVARDHPDVTVELLCDQPCAPPTPHWHAVRIARHERCVWQGPGRGCEPSEVLQFVDDLLRMHVSTLIGRYRPLG